MDIQSIANGVVMTLIPALLKATTLVSGPISIVGEEFFKVLGKAAGTQAMGLMKVIRSKFKGPAAEETINDFVQTPEDKDVQAALRHQLKKALRNDDAFVRQLEELLNANDESAHRTITVIASGKRSVAAGRNISGPVLMGDITGGLTITG